MTRDPQTPAPDALAELAKRLACEVGFSRCGVAAAEPLGRDEFLRAWLADGFAGRMDYLARNNDARNDPRVLLPSARSVICLAADYRDRGPDDLAPAPPGGGYVARYARGRDYHKVLRKRAWRLVDRLREELGGPDFDARVCVDTAPLLERELAARAGLGWVGKNTMLIDPRTGSYFFCAEVLVSLELAVDSPIADHCGTCRRCLDACPTAALPRPGVLNASRCLSYLTIELRDERLPAELADKLAGHLFGCDLCQAVCPFNVRFSKPADDPQLVPADAGERAYLNVAEVAGWSDERCRAEVRGRAAGRATPAMWRRNAAALIDHAE